jgi:hypothetical protein
MCSNAPVLTPGAKLQPLLSGIRFELVWGFGFVLLPIFPNRKSGVQNVLGQAIPIGFGGMLLH